MPQKDPLKRSDLKNRYTVYRKRQGQMTRFGPNHEWYVPFRIKLAVLRNNTADQTTSADHTIEASVRKRMGANWVSGKALKMGDILFDPKSGLHSEIKGIPSNWNDCSRWAVFDMETVDTCGIGEGCECVCESDSAPKDRAIEEDCCDTGSESGDNGN